MGSAAGMRLQVMMRPGEGEAESHSTWGHLPSVSLHPAIAGWPTGAPGWSPQDRRCCPLGWVWLGLRGELCSELAESLGSGPPHHPRSLTCADVAGKVQREWDTGSVSPCLPILHPSVPTIVQPPGREDAETKKDQRRWLSLAAAGPCRDPGLCPL